MTTITHDTLALVHPDVQWYQNRCSVWAECPSDYDVSVITREDETHDCNIRALEDLDALFADTYVETGSVELTIRCESDEDGDWNWSLEINGESVDFVSGYCEAYTREEALGYARRAIFNEYGLRVRV